MQLLSFYMFTVRIHVLCVQLMTYTLKEFKEDCLASCYLKEFVKSREVRLILAMS